jgi:hypothetical protein
MATSGESQGAVGKIALVVQVRAVIPSIGSFERILSSAISPETLPLKQLRPTTFLTPGIAK